MNLSDDHLQKTSVTEEIPQQDVPASETGSSMQEYYQLQQTLLLVTLALTGVIFTSVWIFYSLHIALNYLIGACTGMVYLKMLARDVERLGKQTGKLSSSRLALFGGVIIVASQWHKLQILPIFLGFLTYKAAVIIYMLQSFMPSDSK